MDLNDKPLEGDEISEASDRFSDLYRFKTSTTKKKPGSAKSQGSVDRRLEYGSMTASTMDTEFMLLDAALASGFFETSKDPILLVTPGLLITRINLSAEHTLGYFNKELTSSNVLSLFPQHYAKQFQKRVETFLSNAKPGDIEEVRNAFVERKDGDTFHATIRLNLSQNLEEPCVTFVIRDESDVVFLQQKFQRRERDLLKEIEEKKNHLSRLLSQEEREFYESQKAQEAQIEERARQKNTNLSQTDLFSVRRDELEKEYLGVKAAHDDKDKKFQMEIDSLRKEGKFYDIHGIELERLELLFESESQELKYRQAIQAEELRIRQTTELNYKNEKQTKEAQIMKLKQLREAQIIRRMQKEERQLIKSQKTRSISDLREKQIEEIEELKRKHRQQLFDISNETTKARRSMKYEQQRAAASLLEHQTKISAEMGLQQQKEAEAIQVAQEAEAAANRREQQLAATQLNNHQKEILSMLAERHTQDTHTYKKQLDERKHFELLAEHCNDMISLHKGINGKFRYCSPACQTLLGYSTEEMTDFVYQDLIHPEHKQDVQNELESIVKKMWKNKIDSSREEVVKDNGKGQVFRLCKKDGTNVWIERTIKVLWHPRKPTLDESKPNAQIPKESEPFGQYDVELLFVTRNVSLRVEMEEQQRRTERAQATATTAAQVKRDFLAFIGHECRNPLNALFNITDFLWETDLNEHQRQYLSTIKQCSGDMLRILNDLLDLSKIEAGKIEIETTPFQVRQIVNEALHTMEAEAHKKQLYLKSTIDPNTPNWLLGDPSRLRQILLNLLGNGIKFTEKGGITVSVDVHDRVDEDTLFLQLKVIDTGVGIDKELMSKLFSMYGQASASDFRKYGGTGIGLRLCSLLIQQSMGGNIGIDSQKGEGTTLWFTIPFSTKVPPQALQGSIELSNETILMAPLRRESTVISPSTTSRNNHNNSVSSLLTQTSTLSPTQSGKPMRVLVVDDIALNRDIAVTILSRANCVCTTASDGVEAVATFKENRFDLVFLDIQMPRMTGVEAAYIIREFEKQMSYKRTPIVAISGNVQPSEQALYFQSGMDYFLAKPFKKEDFMSVLTRVKTDFSIASDTTTSSEKNGKGSDSNSKSKGSRNGENIFKMGGENVLRNSTDSTNSNPKDKGLSDENDGKDAGARFPNNNKNTLTLTPHNTSPIMSSLSENPNTSFSNQSTSSPQHNNSSMHVRVLVADSSLADRTIYQKILSQYDSEIVGSGEQALESFTNNTYDAIILDNNLEDVSACDVIAQIRRMEQLSNNHVPIVFVCSSLEEEEALRGCGASQCLIKGRGFVNRDVLLHAMLRCITGESIPKTPIFPDQVSGGHRFSEDEVRLSDLGSSSLLEKKPKNGNSAGEATTGSEATDQNAETSDVVVLDWIFLSRVRSSGFFEDLLKLFISSMETILLALHKYTEERDMRRLVIEAHNGGTISANMGAIAISLVCSTLRAQCGKGWSQEVSQLVSKVDHAVRATLGELLSIDFIRAVPNPSGNNPSWTITEKAVAFGRHRDNFSPPNIGTTVLTSPTLSSDDNQTSTEQIIVNVNVLNPTRVLIVDDVFMNQFIVQSILSKHQFQCDSVNNGAEAIKLFQTHHYDIVLMDVYMDQMSGVDVTRHIREIESKNPKKSHVPIIALTSITGLGRVKFIHQLKEAGVDDVIFKPVLRNNLLNRMEIWRSDISQCYGETPLLDPVILDDLKSMNALESGINQFMENSQIIYDRFNEFSKDILEDKLTSDSRISLPFQNDSLDGENGCSLENSEFVKKLNELTELSGVLGALRMAEFIATLTQYVSKQTIVHFICKKLLKIFQIIRSATLFALNNASSPKIQAIKSPFISPIIPKKNSSNLPPAPSPTSKNVPRSLIIPPLDLTSSFEVDKRRLNDSYDVIKRTPSMSPLNSPNSPNSSISPNSPNVVEVQLSPIRHGEMIFSPKRISRPPHILVVDDQPLTRMVVTSMLLKANPGTTFETAENGEQAVEKAGESDRFSLILMDINMPKMDGLKATRMIRSKQKEIYETKGKKKYALVPIVAITSSAYQHLGTCLDAGMDDMLQKPFTIVKVQEIFKRFIATREERIEFGIEITSEIITPLIQEISNSKSNELQKTYTPTSSQQEIKSLESIFNIEIVEMLSGLGILEKTVETYKEQSQELLQKITDFIQNKSTLTTEERKYSRQQIHALKGISFNSGAQLVGKLCEKMETQVYELDLDTIKKTIENIRNALNDTKERMNEILSRYK